MVAMKRAGGNCLRPFLFVRVEESCGRFLIGLLGAPQERDESGAIRIVQG
jgi:hypothetical protein